MSEIRGRVWQSQRPCQRRRRRAGGSEWSGATWNYEVTIDGVVVAQDNTGYWDSMCATCTELVAATRLVKAALDVGALPKGWAR